MNPTVSAVIPTIGRPSLGRAVQSVLGQTRPVAEVIVVADTDAPVPLPPDDRSTLLRGAFRSGPAPCRQLGIDAARGSVIALLDDDEWYATKLARQLNVMDGGCALDRVVKNGGAGSGSPATELAAAAHRAGRNDHGVPVSFHRPRVRRRCAADLHPVLSDRARPQGPLGRPCGCRT